MRNFFVFFPSCTNEEFAKDPAQLPLNMSRYYNIKSHLISNKLSPDYSDGDFKVSSFFKLFKNEKIQMIAFVILNARKIDWLNLYFLNKSRLFAAKIYKTLNPKGHVYIKMDAGINLVDRLEILDRLNPNLLKQIDIISCETKCMQSIISDKLKRKIVYIPNGFDCRADCTLPPKKDIFLAVGRLGTIPKNTEGLLESFAQSAELHNWKLYLVGPIKEDNDCGRKFKTVIDEYFVRYPYLKDRVKFWGPIYDRSKLKKIYDESKVLLLPSRWEGSPIVIPEALSSGLHILASNEVMLAKDLEKTGYAKTLPYWSTSAWAEEMVNETKRDWNNVNYGEIIDFANEEYSWKSSCKKLYNAMLEIENEGKK